MEDKKRLIKILFLTFFKIGAFTFGGGLAMIPLIQREIAEKRKWITEDELLDMLVIAESTPGPVAINVATFVGYRVCGFWGALFATVGIVLPSFVVIVLISGILQAFEDSRVVQYAFFGIRAGVLALILRALFTMIQKSQRNVFSYALIFGAFLATGIFGVNVLLVMLACAVLGTGYTFFTARRMEK